MVPRHRAPAPRPAGALDPRLLEFAKHGGETLLGLGDGLGTDWIQYARHGAHVVVCSPSAEQLALVRRNFELRGLAGRFLSARPASLPLESSSIDVVCVSGLLDEVADPHAVVNEVYRVLKPGGKVLAVTPARYDVDYWSRLLFPGGAGWVATGTGADGALQCPPAAPPVRPVRRAPRLQAAPAPLRGAAPVALAAAAAAGADAGARAGAQGVQAARRRHRRADGRVSTVLAAP